MTCYQDCHRHYGYLTHETTIARKLLERHGRPRPETVKKLRNETDMPMAECADMLRCMWRDIELERLAGENAKLRELAADMWPFVEGAMDDEYCPAPECPFTELCTENQVCMVSSGFHYRMRELGVEVSDE